VRVLDTFRIAGRGLAVSTHLEGPCPALGAFLVRSVDGARWQVRGIERHAIPWSPKQGEAIAFLLDDDAMPQIGDDFTVDEP
jgi:hypothetical protein